MKIDFDTVLLSPAGTAIPNGDSSALRLADVIMHALVAAGPGDRRTSKDEAVRVFRLAVRIAAGGVQDVSPEDCVLMTQRVEISGLSPYVAGQVSVLLEGGDVGIAGQASGPSP
jgi:hypothetical protein